MEIRANHSKKKRSRKLKHIIRREKFDLGYNMKEYYEFVQDYQEDIARAKRSGDLAKAEELGRELVFSLQAKVVAVHNVVSNTGVRSPGLSKGKFRTNEDYRKMIVTLSDIVEDPKNYKASPLDRIYIPKKDGRKRPISIPSYTDRCLQALYKLSLEPIAEESADPSSYGFRPIRNIAWAAGRVLTCLNNPLTKYGYVIEVDIMGCFDNIEHEFLSSATPLIPKYILWEWLRCGYIERDTQEEYPTEVGVPQGGILSPLLTNITLDGLEQFIRTRVSQAKTGSQGTAFCRYADDMVVFTTTYENALVALQAIKDFLITRGLEIKPSKTRIININDPKEKFVFLGFQFRRVLRRNRKRRTSQIGIPIENIRSFRAKIRKISKSGNKSLHKIIDEMNAVIRGWGNNFKYAHTSIYVFRGLRYWIWKQYYAACYKRVEGKYDKGNHRKIHEELMSKYFSKYESYSDWPVICDQNGQLHVLEDISSIEYIPPTYTNSARNAFITEDREILDKVNLRTKTKHRSKVLSDWGCKCGLCKKSLFANSVSYELHHILPKRFGGKDKPANLVPLCPEPCHKQVSSAVASLNVPEIRRLIDLNVLNIPENFLSSIT